jgi:hypothetical protein
MSKKLLAQRSVLFISRRLFASASSSNLDGQLSKSKPYSEVPALSALNIVARSLPGGKFYKKSLQEIHVQMHAEFGSIVKFAGLFGRPPLLFVYDAKDFETVYITYQSTLICADKQAPFSL